jgi:hypothetical protein
LGGIFLFLYDAHAKRDTTFVFPGHDTTSGLVSSSDSTV